MYSPRLTLLCCFCQSDKIKKLLDNVASGSGMASVMEKTEGMKYLLAVRALRCHVCVRARFVALQCLWYCLVAALPACSCCCLSQMQSQGRDVSEFYPDVVRNVIVRVFVIKQ